MPYGKILIIDEDEKLSALFSEYLAIEGLECSCFREVNNTARYSAIKASVIIIAHTETAVTCREINELRGERSTPVLVTASATTEIDKLEYLKADVDALIMKPFDMTEVCLKVLMLIRRNGNVQPSYSHLKAISYEGLSVNIMTYTVRVDGVPVELSPKEIELLFLLVSRPEYVFEKAELSAAVWGRVLSDSRTVSVHISRIKKKIGRYADNITVLRGVGYKFTKYPKK